MHVPCEVGVGFNAFTLGQDSYHPWFLAAQLATVHDSGEVFNFLGNYYSRVQPKTLWDWHDISPKDSPALAGMPVYGWAVLPWSPDDVQALLQKIELAYVKENREYGLKYGVSAGAKAFGPVSDAKLRIEAQRISRLAVSIQNHGLEHQRADYNVRAVFLLSEGKWRWLTAGGMHRIPVAAGLGILQIPVRVVAVVRREEVEIWPQVESGLYSKEAALALFDRLFEGRPPRCAEPWIAWIDRNKEEFA
jgi:alkanesulfonate monooxygenase SsuD/methylene tetrahydromethanopterin reductase-like flavin-dependent oxidoreductase (luciferase family)